MCLVTWPWIVSETGGDLVLIQTSPLFIVDHAVLVLTSLHLHMKSSEVLYQNKVTPASLPIQGQVTKHTIVKWGIYFMVRKGKGDYMEG